MAKKEKDTAKLTRVHADYMKKMDSLLKGSLPFKSFVEAIKKTGENSVFQRNRHENKTYDDKWVTELDTGFDAIDRIIAHPRTFIKETQDLVLAGQAKRINSTSIRHLASHTRYIHGFNKQGQIVPERILSIGSDVDMQIYENRVLMSLIQRLTFFVEKRVQFISDKGETRNSDVLFIHSKTEIDGVRYEVDNRIKISIESDDKGEYEKNKMLLARIKNLSERVNFYIKSPFMEEMKDAKSVHSPLQMTNLLLKNPDYHKVAVLWKFIDSYTKLGISFDIEEKKGEFDESYFNEVYGLTAASMATLHTHLIDNRKVKTKDEKESAKAMTKHFEPKVMLSLEDETFLSHKFRYDQFPEHESLLVTPEREPEEKDFAWTPDEVKAFKESDNEYLTAEMLTAKELREQAEEERNFMDQEAIIAEMERRKAEEKQLEEERAAAEAKRQEEEAQKLRELEEKIRIETEIRLARENELLKEARERILAMAQEDAPLDESIADELAKGRPAPIVEGPEPLAEEAAGESAPVETASEEALSDGQTFTVPLEQYNADKEQLEALQKENESQAKRIAELEERLAEEEKNKARLAEVEKEKRSEEERGKTVTIIAPSKKIEKITPTVVRVRRGYSKYALDIGGIKTDPFGHITFVGSPHAEQNKAASPKFIKVKKDAKEEKPESKEKVFRIKKAK
ncbi:MAG: hypothetical protein IKQ78_04385 [Bacilli bacterium]|nr:hypothetical protein [Bacilli bacterium]